MSGNQVVVFRPRPRSLSKPALIAAAGTTITFLVSVLRESDARTPLVKALAILAAGFTMFFAIYWGARLLMARRQTVSILPSGLKSSDAAGHEGFCGWQNITDAQIIDTGADPYLRVTGRYPSVPVHIPLVLLENREFVDLLDRHVSEGSPLSLALRSAGA